MFLMFVVLAACAIPAFLNEFRPIPIFDYNSLQIKDHEAAENWFSVQTLKNREERTFFNPRVDSNDAPSTDADAASAVETGDSDSTGRRLSQLFASRSGVRSLGRAHTYG